MYSGHGLYCCTNRGQQRTLWKNMCMPKNHASWHAIAHLHKHQNITSASTKMRACKAVQGIRMPAGPTVKSEPSCKLMEVLLLTVRHCNIQY